MTPFHPRSTEHGYNDTSTGLFGASRSEPSLVDTRGVRDFGPFRLGGSDFFGNRSPRAHRDVITTDAGTSVTVDVLGNDSDPDGDGLSVFVLSGTSHGALDTSSGETLTYSPEPGFRGTDGFAYVVRDGHGGFDVAKAEITVAADPNRAPTGETDAVTLRGGERARVDVLANDSDPDGDDLDVTILSGPADATARVDAAGRIVVEADARFTGGDGIAYAVADGDGERDRALLQLRRPADDAISGDAGRAPTVTFGDTGGVFGDLRDDIANTLEAAWAEWSQAFTRQADIALEVRFAEKPALASAQPGTLATTTDPNGVGQVLQSGVIAELNHGRDPNGPDPDGIITINTDPDAFTWRTDRATPVDADSYDGLTVMLHEIGHVLGFTGFDGDHGSAGGHETTYDSFVDDDADETLVFDGPAAEAVADGPVALGRTDPFHLADPDTLMASAIDEGETRDIDAAELAMLHDMGAPVALDTDAATPIA